MIKNKDNRKIIDVNNLPNTFEIPIEDIFEYNKTNYERVNYKFNFIQDNVKTLSFSELNIKDSSAGIMFDYLGNSLLININGPRECKYRDKIKNDSCLIEVYTKYNVEVPKESNYLYIILFMSS